MPMERLAVAARLARLRHFALELTPAGKSALRLRKEALNAREDLNLKANAIIAVEGHLGAADPALQLDPDLQKKFDAVSDILKTRIAPGPQNIEARRDVLQNALACVAAQRNKRSLKKAFERITSHGFSTEEALDLVKDVRRLGDDIDRRVQEKRSFFANGAYENVDGIRSLKDLNRVLDRQPHDEKLIFGDVLSLETRRRRVRDQGELDAMDASAPTRSRRGDQGGLSIYSDAPSRKVEGETDQNSRRDTPRRPSEPDRLNQGQRVRFEQWVASLAKSPSRGDDRYDERPRGMGVRSV